MVKVYYFISCFAKELTKKAAMSLPLKLVNGGQDSMTLSGQKVGSKILGACHTNIFSSD